MPPRMARKHPLERPENPRPTKRVATSLSTGAHLENFVSKSSKADIAVGKHLKVYRLDRAKFDSVDPDQKALILSDIFRIIVIQSRGKLDPDLEEMMKDDEYTDRWNTFVDNHSDLIDILVECMFMDPPSFNKILELDYLQKPKPQLVAPETSLVSRADYHATVSSWNQEFRGDSAKLLHDTLRSYLKHKADLPYARYAVLLQSSGTGKSRMNDELAKSIIYIPVNLAVKDRSSTRIICPPSDHRKFQNWFWLKSKFCSTQQKSRKHYEGFVFGLITVTKTRLEEMEQSDDAIPELDTLDREHAPKHATLRRLSLLAAKFRSKMSMMPLPNNAQGCLALEYGEYRESFYDDVITEAEKYIDRPDESNSVPASRTHRSVDKAAIQQPHGYSLEEAGNALREFIDPLRLCAEEPLVVICFDDANSFTDSIGGQSYTHFSELRHALRPLNDLPFFSLFVSTGGQAHEISPDSWTFDPSNRCQVEVLNLFPPITEVGFDEFAERVSADGSWTLDRLASTHHISHLGRALFPTRYDNSVPEHRAYIVNFARDRLLGRRFSTLSMPWPNFKDDEKLACLDVRLCLKFRGTHWIDRSEECNQMDHHMRLCVSATRGFKDMFTVAPSEPLLAEAASLGMASWDAAKALLSHIRHSRIDAGGRGELIVALLALLARDNALLSDKPSLDPTTTPAKLRGNRNSMDLKDDGAKRVVRVIDFLQALLPESCHNQLKCHIPSECLTSDSSTETLEETFKNAHIWFNHFIRVRASEADYLWHFLVRGAAIICSNNNGSIDMLIPILFNNRLCKENVSAILIQIKNGPLYSNSIEFGAFESMNPFGAAGVFTEKVRSPRPVIRMVFALAADTPAVEFGPPASSSETKRAGPKSRSRPIPKPKPKPTSKLELQGNKLKFTAYDIRCAGLSSKSFRPINPDEDYIYQELLQCTRDSDELYTVQFGSMDNMADRATARGAMHPGAMVEHRHFVDDPLDSKTETG